MTLPKERGPELRELVKEYHERLYHFCFYMLGGDSAVDDLVLCVFREFGGRFLKMLEKREVAWEPLEIRLKLFKIAWEKIKINLKQRHANLFFTEGGRDTRPLMGMDDDLLDFYRAQNFKSEVFEKSGTLFLERLGRVDSDFRAPLILRDMLGFEDEEVARILEMRWGVYRHRLHRGRLEFKEILRGRPHTDIKKANIPAG